MDIDKLVDEFPHKSKKGFTSDEIKELVESVPELNLDMDEFESALFGITVAMENGKHIYYPHDVKKAFDWGVGNKKPLL